MPRVADIYSRPAGIDGIPNQTIESADYNLNVADVETDLNLPRPIVAGGTGATSAAGARDNIDAEVAAATVTNYDSHVFENGSFYSLTGATAQPVSSHVTGSAVIVAANPDYVMLQAVALDGSSWTRIKNAGVWGAWTSDDGKYVNVTGDTMTGNLIAPNLTATGAVTSGSFFSSSTATAILTSTGAGQILLRPNGGGSAVGQLALDSAGGVTVAGGVNIAGGAVVAGAITVGTTVASSSTTLGLSTAGAGTIFLRPNGSASAVGEVSLSSAGEVNLNGPLVSNASVISTGGPIVGSARISVRFLTGQWGMASDDSSSLGGNNFFVFTRAGGAAILGSITNNANAGVAYNTTSDERLKEDLKSFDAGHIVDDTNVYDFAWKETGARSYGVIAQQAKDVYPHATTYDESMDRWFIDYSKYVPVILQELKALRARVAELESKVGIGVQPA